MWMLCRRYSGREAEQMGLVNVCVPGPSLDDEVARWCREILQLSPTCLRILKASFEAQRDRQWTPVRHFGNMLAPDLDGGAEAEEAGRAFLEKREPSFFK